MNSSAPLTVAIMCDIIQPEARTYQSSLQNAVDVEDEAVVFLGCFVYRFVDTSS